MRERLLVGVLAWALIGCRGGAAEEHGERTTAIEVGVGKAGPTAKQPAPEQAELAQPEPACAPPSGSWYLHLSDVHLGTTVAAQQPGGDTSVPLWDATKAKLREVVAGPNPPAFILYTGDLPDHAPDRGELHTTNISAVLGDLKAIAGSIPFLYLPGNNDSLDWDYASFTSAGGDTPLSASGWAGPTLNLESEGVPSHGYYSAVPVAGLRVVALNTVIMSASYPCAHQQQTPGTCSDRQSAEVDEQLAWLVEQLAAAGAAKQKVLLAMHIPPGIDAYSSPKPMWKQQAWEDRLLAAIADSPSEVVGLAFGHTHLDELRRLYDANGELELIALSAPGITPGHGNNPGFKAISFGADFRPTDALTWYASASDPAAPVYAYAADGCYRYAEVFGCEGGEMAANLAACLGTREVCALAGAMDGVYTVKHGAPSYSTAPGIDVRPGGVAPASCPAGN